LVLINVFHFIESIYIYVNIIKIDDITILIKKNLQE
jgi:hypothetical protein